MHISSLDNSKVPQRLYTVLVRVRNKGSLLKVISLDLQLQGAFQSSLLLSIHSESSPNGGKDRRFVIF